MEAKEAASYFLSTDPMHFPLKSSVENGRVLAVAYKDAAKGYDELVARISDLETKLENEKQARNKDNAFSTKEIADLNAKGVVSVQTIVTPILNKLLEIENMLLKEKRK